MRMFSDKRGGYNWSEEPGECDRIKWWIKVFDEEN